jgi:uncharacterized protein YfbU (UPF0304 family)
MKLTDGEKLIILMLADLYEKLRIDGETDPDFLRSAIFNNHLWGIRWKYSGIPFEPAEDPTVVREVVDILEMWSFMEFAYAEKNEEQKRRLAELAKPFRDDPRFTGFDGNNESEYMSAALFLVNQLDRFQNFKGRDLNCHHPSLAAHRRMLAVFESLRASLAYETLSVEQLAKLLNERIDPRHREA